VREIPEKKDWQNLHTQLSLLQERLPRLGLLGLACSDGCLRVMVYVHLIFFTTG